MPMLDFACKQCGHKFEELVALNPKNPTKCPRCGSTELARVYEGPCLFGSSASSSGGCSGNCASCHGCHHG